MLRNCDRAAGLICLRHFFLKTDEERSKTGGFHGNSLVLRIRVGSMTEPTIRQRLEADAEGVLAEEFSRNHDRFWRMVDFRLDAASGWSVSTRTTCSRKPGWRPRSACEHFVENESLSLFVWLRMIVQQTLVDVQRRHLGVKKRDAFRERSLQARSVGLGTRRCLLWPS